MPGQGSRLASGISAAQCTGAGIVVRTRMRPIRAPDSQSYRGRRKAAYCRITSGQRRLESEGRARLALPSTDHQRCVLIMRL